VGRDAGDLLDGDGARVGAAAGVAVKAHCCNAEERGCNASDCDADSRDCTCWCERCDNDQPASRVREAERRAERAELELRRLRAIEAADNAWPLRDVLARLADAAEHLLHDHGCDLHGHEEIRRAVIRAREIRAGLDAKVQP
jgi:hypothetical protein